ncbi:MAG: hypothetical protein HYW79_02675 [Parcubacteria group bacterium]|nr:hypothetical protein [Parcubacteria group bacterium]
MELSDDEKQLLRDLEDAQAVAYTTRIPTLSRLTPIRQKKIPRQLPLFKKMEKNCEGHFLLASGRHTNVFIQTALGLRYVHISQSIGFRLYKLLKERNLLDSIDVMVGPPMGAISVINALLYAINSTKIEAMYLERNSEGKFRLGRGFELNGDKRVLLVDDIFSTGGSFKKTIAACNEASANEDDAECQFIGAAVVVNRASNQEMFRRASTTIPIVAALTYPLKDWSNEECPYCAYDVPLYKL